MTFGPATPPSLVNAHNPHLRGILSETGIFRQLSGQRNQLLSFQGILVLAIVSSSAIFTSVPAFLFPSYFVSLIVQKVDDGQCTSTTDSSF